MEKALRHHGDEFYTKKKNPTTLYKKVQACLKGKIMLSRSSINYAFLNLEKSRVYRESGQHYLLGFGLYHKKLQRNKCFFIILFSFFAKDVVGHLLSAALPWKSNQVIRFKAKGEFIAYQCHVKIKFDQWNKLIILTAEQTPEKCNHACNNSPVVNWDAHTTTVLFLQQPLKYQNASKF